VRLQQQYEIRRVFGFRLAGDAFHGWLFFLDKRRMTLDDMTLGQIVAGQVATRLEHSYLLQRLQQSAVLEERMRFARDLHDGLLQSLAGTALQLHNLRRTLAEHPDEVLGRLHELENSILTEQGSLRAFIRELRPSALLPHDTRGDLATSLRNLVDRVERHWGLRVDLTVCHLDASGGEALGYHVSHIVHEALVNAARHGGASSVRVEVEERGGEIVILAADNGHGFGFHGRYDVVALTRMNAGPVSLRERITALGGTLTVESSASGARLEITLPLRRAAV
jgi:signal transduction histidine kinase